MKFFSHRRVASYLSVFFILIVSACGGQQKSEATVNYITFSKADKAADFSTGKNVRVAVIDWLFDMSDEAMGKYVDPVSMVPGEKIGELKPWHGEWMAQIIHSIAPDVKIIPIRARSQEKKGYEDFLIRGIYYAADHGAVAVTSSMGPLTQSAALDSAIEYAENHGMIFVDVHPETIKVEGEKPRLCQTGECNNRIIHTGIVTVPDYPAEPESNRDIYTWAYDIDPVYKDGWGYSNGPPIVAGVIALMKSVNPDLTPDQLRQLIKETAYEYKGFNCIDADAAVKAAIAAKNGN